LEPAQQRLAPLQSPSQALLSFVVAYAYDARQNSESARMWLPNSLVDIILCKILTAMNISNKLIKNRRELGHGYFHTKRAQPPSVKPMTTELPKTRD